VRVVKQTESHEDKVGHNHVCQHDENFCQSMTFCSEHILNRFLSFVIFVFAVVFLIFFAVQTLLSGKDNTYFLEKCLLIKKLSFLLSFFIFLDYLCGRFYIYNIKYGIFIKDFQKK